MDRDQREASPLHFDATGKVTLDHLYSQDDPRPYFGVEPAVARINAIRGDVT